jgi:hypothetical protein
VVRKRLETIGLLALERLAVESEPGENRTVDAGWPRGPVASCVLLLRSNGKRPRGNLSPPSHSDFSGWVYLTSSEAKIEFKPVEPRNPWIDAFSSELGRQVLVVLS